LNNAGWATGFAQDASGVSQAFLRSPDGVVSTLVDPSTGLALNNVAQGINSAGAVVGSYFTASGSMRGFELSPDRATLVTLADPLATGRTAARGINDSGTVVGFYGVASAIHGFVFDPSTSSYTTLDNPLGVGGTYLQGINNQGQIVGFFGDAANQYHAFVYDSGAASFTTIDAPGSSFSQAFQINSLGQVAVLSDVGSYIYDPVPEPPPMALLAAGLLVVAAVSRRRR
jgi:probable HAF family extracellular repeat protein